LPKLGSCPAWPTATSSEVRRRKEGAYAPTSLNLGSQELPLGQKLDFFSFAQLLEQRVER
jgi:hypothetical protein